MREHSGQHRQACKTQKHERTKRKSHSGQELLAQVQDYASIQAAHQPWLLSIEQLAHKQLGGPVFAVMLVPRGRAGYLCAPGRRKFRNWSLLAWHQTQSRPET